MDNFINYCFLENWKVMMLVLPFIVIFSKKICKPIARWFEMPFIIAIPLLLEIFILMNFAFVVLFDNIQQSSNIVVLQGIPQYLVSFTMYFAFYQVFDKMTSLPDEINEILK